MTPRNMPDTFSQRTILWILLGIFGIHAGLLAVNAYVHSPSWDEVAHLPAGLHVVDHGGYAAYCVNPPLVRMLAALPVYMIPHQNAWMDRTQPLSSRQEFFVGSRFVEKNGSDVFFLFTVARWTCIPLSILAAWICYRFAKDLYGVWSGLLAATLWCFSPLVLGHGALMTPDVGASALGAASVYTFYLWLENPTWKQTGYAGLFLGLAELAKFTLILFYLLFPVLFLFWICTRRNGENVVSPSRQLLRFCGVIALSLFVLNSGYEWKGTFKPLGEYQFVSQTLKGQNTKDKTFGNRFQNTALAHIPVPFPEHYIGGIDVQKVDFERTMPSYLRGEWRDGGWYYYYVYGLLIKEPLGNWCLLLVAVSVTVGFACYRNHWREEILLLTPVVVIVLVVSLQTGFNHHIRYLLPMMPLAFVWISKVASGPLFQKRSYKALIGILLFWSIASSLYYFPHSMSYFNELVGGPKNGHYHLGNSNIDWGQDLLFLGRWLKKHPDVKPDSLAYDMPLVNPTLVGVPSDVAPPTSGRPEPGWHIVSVNQIHRREDDYLYFLAFTPVDRIGYSMNVYHLTPEDVEKYEREHETPIKEDGP